MIHMLLYCAFVVAFRLSVVPDPICTPRCRTVNDVLLPVLNGMWLSGIPP